LHRKKKGPGHDPPARTASRKGSATSDAASLADSDLDDDLEAGSIESAGAAGAPSLPMKQSSDTSDEPSGSTRLGMSSAGAIGGYEDQPAAAGAGAGSAGSKDAAGEATKHLDGEDGGLESESELESGGGSDDDEDDDDWGAGAAGDDT